jgi:starch phosphorylase
MEKKMLATETLAPEFTWEAFKARFVKNLAERQAVGLTSASPNDKYLALAYTVRDYLTPRWLTARAARALAGVKIVYYLSAEYLLGRQLDNAMLAAGLNEIADQALHDLGIDLDTLRALEREPGLGNGGLGRLAACFLDSLATQSIPAIGYGLLYEYGIFEQTFVNGAQVEKPDTWMTRGAPWLFTRPERAVTIGFGGHTETYLADGGQYRVRWHPARHVTGIPNDMMVPGYGTDNVGTLRLWRARAINAFDLEIFNGGDYERAVEQQTAAENISKVLYPEDSTPQGKALRLQQQYFFVACSLIDILRHLPEGRAGLERLPELAAVQLNDTHPTIAIPELMRLLIDDHGLTWDEAWSLTTRTMGYTCHTLMPEALETWSVELLGGLLPRHLEIIYEINQRFLDDVRARFPGNDAKVRNMSLIAEEGGRRVRMAHLAAVGSHAINGVAELHSKLLRDYVLHDFYEMAPEKFTNVTNGVTPRRFMRLANPDLAALITRKVGDLWLRNLDLLKGLEAFADDPEFQLEWQSVKAHNKYELARFLRHRDGIEIDPGMMYDVMVKRLHEYKRQLLKLLHTINLYQRLKAGEAIVPRAVIFGAKAAPGYWLAKEVIRLINGVGDVINNDPAAKGRLAIAFPANYNVTLAERIYAAADLSEQISLAGKEASGTGNMKLALNGALTVGTLDGANIEIREHVGAENFFLCGMTEPEVVARQTAGYDPYGHYASEPALKAALDAIAIGAFSHGDRQIFKPIVDSLLTQDRFMVLADFASYLEAQAAVDRLYQDQAAWTRMSILNVARCGYFSSDRAIQDYCARIWGAQPLHWEADPEPADPRPRRAGKKRKAG